MADSPSVAAARRRLCASTSWRTVCWPLPTTSGGRRTAAATTLPLMTTTRRSSPSQRSSSSTSGQCSRGELDGRGRVPSAPVTPTVMPAPCSPRAGFTTTVADLARGTSWSASVKVAVRPAGHAHARLGDDPAGDALVVAAAHRDRVGEFGQRFPGDDAGAAVREPQIATLGVERPRRRCRAGSPRRR